MSNVNIIVAGKHHTFREPVIGLEQSLQELGHSVNSVSWYVNNGDKIRIGNNNIYIGALYGRNIPIHKDRNNIYFCTEQYLINSPISNSSTYIQFYDDIRERFTVVVDMFKQMIHPTKKAVHRYCPIGWSPIWEENCNPDIKETINLLHLGVLQLKNTKRTGIHGLVKRTISYGKQRDYEIQAAKINLSLQTFSQGYEWTPYRMLYVVGKRKFLMADKHIDYGPYIPNKHFIEFIGNDIRDTYNEWINKPDERKQFAMAAYEDIKENHRYSMYLDEALKGVI